MNILKVQLHINQLKPRDEHVFDQKVLKWLLFDFKKFLMCPATDKGSAIVNGWFEHVSRNWWFLWNFFKFRNENFNKNLIAVQFVP